MSPFLNTPDVFVQREKTRAVIETDAGGAEVIAHHQPPGSGWHFIDGDSATASWARLLTPVVDEDGQRRSAVLIQATQPLLLEDKWSVVLRRQDGSRHVLSCGLPPAAAFTMANAIHIAFGAAMELPSGFEVFVQASALMVGGGS